ncbi:Phox homologous domain-containing protein [Geopyxis carbonaria]|nr:Phox homologous domain-containing protein [Geopyxis carbonaria]
MSLELAIPHTSEATAPGKPHTLYHIQLRLPIRSYTVQKRYNDFIALHDALTTHTGAPPPQSPPPKHFLSSTVGNAARTEERRAALEAYLLAILRASDTRWRDSPAWRSFLSLPASWSSSSARTPPAIAAYTALPTGPITDPTVWLDSHRELKALLHDARIALSRRDVAPSVAEAHEASAASKRSLVRAGALITALDAGLNVREPLRPALLDGELRRRRDLISSARKERDGLESLAAQRRAEIATATTPNPAAEKSALFGAAAGRGSGRVLGAPLPETNRTRELDNTGVLGLQQQMMQEQEAGVDRLLRVVRRQKEMGLAIGEELEVQKQMLDDLEHGVDRVEAKTRVARKRADKIS